MNKALRKIRSLTAQASFAAATFAVMPSGFAQSAPAPKGPSAACAQQQKTINEKGLEKFSVPDLIAHPVLAGDTIKIQIRVRDALNKVGQSETCSIKLPAQEFRHPVSKAMVELRRTLAVSPKKSNDVAQRFGQLLTAQGHSVQNPQTLEALKTLQNNIATAEGPDALESGVRSMWELMQRLEQENMSAAEKRLREMEQALREALRRGADQEQIRELTSEAMKAMQDALKEQADKAKQNPQDPQAQKDFEDMQKRLEEMQKMLDELQNVDKKTAQEMQKMMQQMQELMKQQQQMQQQQQQQQQDAQDQQPQNQQNQKSQQQQQQQQQQKMRQNMQQRMQQMQQRMQQQQQNQQMQQDMENMIKQQEELRNQTAEERERRKEDMDAVLKQLEEYAKKLREQIQERRMEEYNNQNELYRRNNGNTAPDNDFQMDGASNHHGMPFMVKVSSNGDFSSKRAESLPPPHLDTESIQKRLQRLGDMDRDVTGTAKGLEKKRIDQEQLRESEAESIIDQFQQIQRELQKQEKEQPPKTDKNQQQQSDQQKQQQQQQQQDMLDRIKKLMEQMKKKPQNQKQQQQQNQQQNGQQQQQQKSMSQEQRDLQKKLQEMMNKMRQRGMDPGKLQDADKPMDQSAQELDQNDPGDAIPHQEEVLKNLREGQKQMQQQMQQQQQGQQPGQGQGEGQGEGDGDGEHEPDADALGRSPSSPEQLEFEKDTALSQKRRADIERLLEGKNLPQATREYYERLLKGKNQRPSLAP